MHCSIKNVATLIKNPTHCRKLFLGAQRDLTWKCSDKTSWPHHWRGLLRQFLETRLALALSHCMWIEAHTEVQKEVGNTLSQGSKGNTHDVISSFPSGNCSGASDCESKLMRLRGTCHILSNC
eukprot:4859830-Amphidinium_carterae.1